MKGRAQINLHSIGHDVKVIVFNKEVHLHLSCVVLKLKGISRGLNGPSLSYIKPLLVPLTYCDWTITCPWTLAGMVCYGQLNTVVW